MGDAVRVDEHRAVRNSPWPRGSSPLGALASSLAALGLVAVACGCGASSSGSSGARSANGITQEQLNGQLLDLADLPGWGHEGDLENAKSSGNGCGKRRGVHATFTAEFAASDDPISGPAIDEYLGAYDSPSDARAAYKAIKALVEKCTSFKEDGDTVRVGIVELPKRGDLSFVFRGAASKFVADTYITLVGSQIMELTLLDVFEKPDDDQLLELVDKAIAKMRGIRRPSSSTPSATSTPRSSPAPTVTATQTVAPIMPTVPNVIGKTQNDAIQLLKAQGFNVSISVRPDTAPDNTVVGQDPNAGTRLPSGSIVTIFVSSGPPLQANPSPTSSTPRPSASP